MSPRAQRARVRAEVRREIRGCIRQLEREGYRGTELAEHSATAREAWTVVRDARLARLRGWR